MCPRDLGICPDFSVGHLLPPRQYWLPSCWQWRASSPFVSTRSGRESAGGQDLLQVFASYGSCFQSLWTSGKILSTLCSHPQSRNGITQLSDTSGDGSRVEKVWHLWQRSTSFSGKLRYNGSSHSISKSLAKSIRREIYRDITSRVA